MNISFFTLGCKVNQYETDVMMNSLENSGHKVVNSTEKSDFTIINSCTVTDNSDKKIRQLINKIKKENPYTIIVLTGCYAQNKQDELKNNHKIDIIIGNKRKSDISEIIQNYLVDKSENYFMENYGINESYHEFFIINQSSKTRANIKIQDGCNQYCAYCIIPFVRGPVRSRKIENIIKEIEALVDNGYQEIVLNGIHIASFGKDNGESLVELISLVQKKNFHCRFRLGSLDPGVISEELMYQLSKTDDFCRHFHLSLQSGSDSVLNRMRRKYTTDEFYNKIQIIRKMYPEAGITTDIIVGFPGETEEEFRETCEFAEKIGFSKVHIFKYSSRKGTVAAEMSNQVSETEKKIRSKILTKISKSEAEKFYKKFIGKELKVLFEDKEEGMYKGHSDNYLSVKIKSKQKLSNCIINVKIEKYENEALIVLNGGEMT